MKTRTINIEAYNVDFVRKGDGVVAKIGGQTKGSKIVKVNATFSFRCLPHFMPRLRKEWSDARDIRIGEIDRIDKSLGT